jgi:hypothetical protein
MLIDMDEVKSKISKMDKDKLTEYGIITSMSELDRELKIAIYQEIEHRIDYIETFGDALAIDSEVNDFEDFKL